MPKRTQTFHRCSQLRLGLRQFAGEFSIVKFMGHFLKLRQVRFGHHGKLMQQPICKLAHCKNSKWDDSCCYDKLNSNYFLSGSCNLLDTNGLRASYNRNSIFRLVSRPSLVLFEAIGWLSPNLLTIKLRVNTRPL